MNPTHYRRAQRAQPVPLGPKTRRNGHRSAPPRGHLAESIKRLVPATHLEFSTQRRQKHTLVMVNLKTQFPVDQKLIPAHTPIEAPNPTLPIDSQE
jgi:hypothetical protein